MCLESTTLYNRYAKHNTDVYTGFAEEETKKVRKTTTKLKERLKTRFNQRTNITHTQTYVHTRENIHTYTRAHMYRHSNTPAITHQINQHTKIQ